MGYREVDRNTPEEAGPVPAAWPMDLAAWDEPRPKGPGPRLLTRRRVAVALAAMVVSIPMLMGIGGLVAHPRDIPIERSLRRDAARAEDRGEAQRAARLRAEAAALAEWNNQTWWRRSALLATLAVASTLAAIGWSRRIRHPADRLAGGCSTLATVLFVAFALAIVEALTLFALVASLAD